ncbi:MAG: hypothetical protein ACRDTD_13175 [Pseudonocardiaceae bacterium]
MSDAPDQHHPERDQHHPERVRLYAQAHRLSNSAGCVLLVMQTDDGWSIHGLDLPGQGVHVPNDPKAGTGIHVSTDSMFLLAKSIVAKTIVDRSGQ